MDVLYAEANRNKSEKCDNQDYLKPGSANLTVQLGLSLILGVSAFVAFCVCRWCSLVSIP